jgi:hypothetical protein
MEWVHWTKRIVCVWFVRVVWAPALGWGLVNWLQFATTSRAGTAREELFEDAATRTAGGIVLFLIWLFFVRRRGPWTLNRQGRLERTPDEERAEQARPE